MIQASARRVIRFDESGFTGSNLLDDAQRFFVIGSTDLSDDDADAILKGCFPRYNGAEFKFMNIWKAKNRTGLIEFAKAVGQMGPKRIGLYIADKRFALFTKMVDSLIEPYMTDMGYDFYDDGFCWKYANYLYFGFCNVGDPLLLDSILRSYQRFSREPSLEFLEQLTFTFQVMAQSAEPSLKTFLRQLALGAELFQKFHDIEEFRGSNDLQVSSMIATIGRWRQRCPEDFEVVHDASSNFMRSRDLWERVTNGDVPEQEQKLGDGSMLGFPLRVVATRAVNSLDSRSVQFCDILAGSAAKRYAPNATAADEALMNAMLEAGLGNIDFIPLIPSGVFPDQIPPKRLSGPDSVDRFGNIMFGSHHSARAPR